MEKLYNENSIETETIYRKYADFYKYGRDVFKFTYNDLIIHVIFNNPATIVFWCDGTKTVVKCSIDETFDEEKGLAMAIAKKFFGNCGNYYNIFKKWLPTIDKKNLEG